MQRGSAREPCASGQGCGHGGCGCGTGCCGLSPSSWAMVGGQVRLFPKAQPCGAQHTPAVCCRSGWAELWPCRTWLQPGVWDQRAEPAQPQMCPRQHGLPHSPARGALGCCEPSWRVLVPFRCSGAWRCPGGRHNAPFSCSPSKLVRVSAGAALPFCHSSGCSQQMCSALGKCKQRLSWLPSGDGS